MEEVNYVPTVQLADEVKSYADKESQNPSIFETATTELTEKDIKNLEELRDAKVKQAAEEQGVVNKDSMNSAVINGSSINLTPEQIAKLRPRPIDQQVRKFKKIGRNDKCPCGSGKKYKDCCLKTGKYEGYQSHRKGQTKNPYMKEAA